MSVDGRYIVPVTHCVETRMDTRGKIVIGNTENPKSHTINIIIRYDKLIVGMDCTGRIGGTL